MKWVKKIQGKEKEKQHRLMTSLHEENEDTQQCVFSLHKGKRIGQSTVPTTT